MTENRRLLLEALRETPADRNLHLIYADAVEEDGDSDLARFVRIAAFPVDETRPERKRLRKRFSRQWRGRYKLGWAPGLVFEGGLLVGVSARWGAFESTAPSLLAEHPITALTLTRYVYGQSLTPNWSDEFKAGWERRYPRVKFTWPGRVEWGSDAVTLYAPFDTMVVSYSRGDVYRPVNQFVRVNPLPMQRDPVIEEALRQIVLYGEARLPNTLYGLPLAVEESSSPNTEADNGSDQTGLGDGRVS